MSRLFLWARFALSRATLGELGRLCVFATLMMVAKERAEAAAGDDIRLELHPRICTLSARDKQCESRVQAKWQAPRQESLCLVIVDRPEIKRCWENYSEGVYSIELVFAEDVVFQLKDPELQHVLASEALRVIREAVRYRHKRREPWNIFD